MIGTRVRYRGSLDDHWGRYLVAAEVTTDDGPRYDLATYAGVVMLVDVGRTSFEPVPLGRTHVVGAPDLRCHVVQR
jgi:hypothetical protein